MNYRNSENGEPISILGYGCMRFTKSSSLTPAPARVALRAMRLFKFW